MRATCRTCGYAVEADSVEGLAARVRETGGLFDAAGITCPNGHSCERSGRVRLRGLGSASAAGVLLRVAAGLGGEFTVSDLTVRAWRADPGRFGLKGYEEQYPDVKRVQAELTKRLAGVGLAERVRPLTYRLTAAGQTVAGGGA